VSDQLHAPASLHLRNGSQYRLNRRLCGPQRRFGRFGEQSLDSVANRTADCPAHSPIPLPITLSRCVIIRAGFGDGYVRWMQIARESVFFYTYNSEVRLKDSVNVLSVSSEIRRLYWTFCRPQLLSHATFGLCVQTSAASLNNLSDITWRRP
jgi:hypothetical protein